MASSHERVNFFSDARANRVRSAARLLKVRPKRDALVRYSDRVGEASGEARSDRVTIGIAWSAAGATEYRAAAYVCSRKSRMAMVGTR